MDNHGVRISFGFCFVWRARGGAPHTRFPSHLRGRRCVHSVYPVKHGGQQRQELLVRAFKLPPGYRPEEGAEEKVEVARARRLHRGAEAVDDEGLEVGAEGDLVLGEEADGREDYLEEAEEGGGGIVLIGLDGGGRHGGAAPEGVWGLHGGKGYRGRGLGGGEARAIGREEEKIRS